MNLSVLLWGIPQAMRAAAKVYPEYAARLRERNLIAQFRLRDKPEGRWIQLDNGRVRTGKGLHDKPDVTLFFKNKAIAESFLTPPFDMLERIDAAKNFKIGLEGPEDLAVWFMQTLARLESVTWKSGTDMGNGVTRYTTGSNSGPLFVYVKDGKILRTTPIDFDDSDAPPWSITARGKPFTPLRRTTTASHAVCLKSMVYSKSRLLHPMKRQMHRLPAAQFGQVVCEEAPTPPIAVVTRKPRRFKVEKNERFGEVVASGKGYKKLALAGKEKR